MKKGYVQVTDSKVLIMLHPKWVKEMEHEGKLIVYGEEKKMGEKPWI